MTASEFNTYGTKRDFIFLFIFLGSRVPRYLVENVRHTAEIFPEIDVVLATTSSHQLSLKRARHLVLPQSLIRPGGNAGFRAGFWSKTFDRLFAIEAVHEDFPDRRVLHIEGDVKLSPSLNLESFSDSKLNWGRVTADEDGAALLQSPNLEASQRLSELLRFELEANRDITDMSALANIRLSHPDLVELLPTEIDRSTSEIFDFAPLGMWLGGTDPRNNYGVSRFRQPQKSHIVDASRLNFAFQNQSLLVSRAEARETASQLAKVQNLHLHAKRAKFFSLDWNSAVEGLLDNTRSSTFSFAAALAWAADRLGEYWRATRNLAQKFLLKDEGLF